MKPHGNSKKSERLHHLYEIWDRKKDATFKYGISGDPLNKDGASSRAEKQVRLFNRVAGWLRFFARILIKNIKGRKKARLLEEEHIKEYAEKYGEKPDGNV